MDTVPPDIKPGIYPDIPSDAYHTSPGISKSGLWTIYTQSPAHYKFGEREQTKAFDFGEAAHFAILQPEIFEARVVRGPEDRRGNKWKDLVEICAIDKKLLLTGPDYDGVLAIRDAVHADAWINGIVTGGKPEIEHSGYWADPTTGLRCRCRPDLYRRDLKIMLDVKSTRSAHPDAFARSVINYGYHAQEAFYSDGYNILAAPVDGFAFLVFEKEPPYAYAVYELPPSIVDEGRAIMRKALDIYNTCANTDNYTAYGSGVQELAFQRWSYRETIAPTDEEE